ncbi:MAG: Sulfatase, partial [uncultured Solirubrobacterales bacterium]
DRYPQHSLPPFARHRALRAALRLPGADSEHPAPGRSRNALSQRLLRGSNLLREPRLLSH